MTSLSIKDFDAAMNLGATSKAGVSKLVQAWEAKNNERTKRAAGLGLMAVSLAACGGSDDSDDGDDDIVDPAPVSLALNATQDIYTALTEWDDTITGTQATIGATDVIVDDHSDDNDTLTITSDGTAINLGSVVGIENIVVNVTAFGAAGAITATNVASGTLTVNNLQLAGTTDVDVDFAGNITVVAGSGATGTIDVAMVAAASTIVNSGEAANVIVTAAAATDTITVVAADDINLTSIGANTLRISGSGDVTLNGNSTLLAGATGSITGTAAQTLIAAVADDIDGATITGFGSISIDTNTDTSSTIDARNWSGTILVTNGLVADTLTIASGATVSLAADQDIKLDIDDGAAGTTTTTGVANVILGAASTAGGGTIIAIDATDDLIGTLNVTVGANQTAGDLRINATTAVVVNLSGTGNVDLDTGGFGTVASSLNASGLSGILTAAVDTELLSITGGSGNDAITALTAVAFNLVGGAGTDTLTLAADMSAGTFSGFEVLTGTGDFLSTQLSGLSAVVAAGSTITIGAGDVHSNTINLSGLTFADTTNGVSMAAATQDTAFILSDSAMTITGSNGADVLRGFGGSDVISGGAGADTITGGAGNDTLTGGTGADVFVFNSLVGSDIITDYVVADDSIQLSKATYTGLGAVGALAGAEFESGAGLVAAATAAGRIVYDTTAGNLYYDADGSGAGLAVLIGTFTAQPTLTAAEFAIIA